MKAEKVVDALLMLLIVVILAGLVWMFLENIADAQGGGRCYATYIKYYNRSCRCYITEKVWRCTGYIRPRQWRRY